MSKIFNLVLGLQFFFIMGAFLFGDILFTETHEEIHQAIFRELGEVNSTVRWNFLSISAQTIPNANETLQNPQLVMTAQAITEIYQYQTITGFTVFLVAMFFLSLSNTVAFYFFTRYQKRAEPKSLGKVLVPENESSKHPLSPSSPKRDSEL